jgi:hypothetical protein
MSSARLVATRADTLSALLYLCRAQSRLADHGLRSGPGSNSAEQSAVNSSQASPASQSFESSKPDCVRTCCCSKPPEQLPGVLACGPVSHSAGRPLPAHQADTSASPSSEGAAPAAQAARNGQTDGRRPAYICTVQQRAGKQASKHGAGVSARGSMQGCVSALSATWCSSMGASGCKTLNAPCAKQ